MLIDFSDLPRIRESSVGHTVVFGGGCFDLFHEGHLEFVETLKTQGDIVVVAVSSDENIRNRKGTGRPVIKQNARVRIIDAIRHVDFALIAPTTMVDGNSPSVQIINALRPDLFVTRDRNWLPHQHKVTAHGTAFVLDEAKKIESTSSIIRRIGKESLLQDKI